MTSWKTWRRAAASVVGLCMAGVALAQQPAWTVEERTQLIAAWQHTAGGASFEYKLVVFETEQQARVARASKWGEGTRYKVYDFRADSLVDVDPALRVPVAQLYDPQQRSPLVRWVRKTGAIHWAVLELVKRSPLKEPRDAADFDARARRWVAQGYLPAPAELATDLEHRARAAYWFAGTPEAVKAVPAELSPNVSFGNEMTPLTSAVLGSRLSTVEALLARGADPNRCAFWGCPLHIALALKDAAISAQAVQLLLAAGAKPGQNDARFEGSRDVPLNEAIRSRRVEAVKALLDAGASPDGAPGVQITPLVASVLTGDRALLQLLLDRGATPLPHDDRGLDSIGRPITIVAMAGVKGDKELVAWSEKLMMDAALKAPRYRWDAHIEQDGRRIPIVDGAEVALKAAPFKLVLTLPPPAHEYGVSIAASYSAALADEVRRPDRGNGIFIPTRSGALPEPPKEDSYELFLYDTRPADPKPDDTWGGNVHLSVNKHRRDFHEIRAAKHEHVREFRAVASISDKDGVDDKGVPLSALKGKRITLALGGFLPTEEWVGRLVAPRVVTLVLR
ncbi:ankyrin repeat domain-containing protein [Piscinibacter sp. HJYY11]|uniref:ankyrin repeat domain-containing protein n=1 Tax=Piscinibacter sp. HJYY11 TaxID=2801333 RepID=UPI00191D7858|nr:ankyrin repeat domain-containing protein [Piscinibacter sp. HJYY11]MBL0727413.1 ankyrin repeat domain-containing protein [Piscinibacter sp. HJYY11]